MTESDHEHPFYGHIIVRRKEEDYIRSLMKKYHGQEVNEELRRKVWDELQMEKHLGKVTIPFKLAVRKDPYGKFPDILEVILDTKI